MNFNWHLPPLLSQTFSNLRQIIQLVIIPSEQIQGQSFGVTLTQVCFRLRKLTYSKLSKVRIFVGLIRFRAQTYLPPNLFLFGD